MAEEKKKKKTDIEAETAAAPTAEELAAELEALKAENESLIAELEAAKKIADEAKDTMSTIFSPNTVKTVGLGIMLHNQSETATAIPTVNTANRNSSGSQRPVQKPIPPPQIPAAMIRMRCMVGESHSSRLRARSIRYAQ